MRNDEGGSHPRMLLTNHVASQSLIAKSSTNIGLQSQENCEMAQQRRLRVVLKDEQAGYRKHQQSIHITTEDDTSAK
jgi:hypothetical protein